MSTEDRQRWNRRYRDGAYAGREHPSEWLQHCLDRIGPDTAPRPLTVIDLACGAGRNALYLAARGHAVHAVDIAGEALQRGRRKAEQEQHPGAVHWMEHDLDRGLPEDLPRADLVLMIRYLALDLIASAAALLNAGGHLLVDVHLQSGRDVAGPRNPDFRAAPGALRKAVSDAGLIIVEYREGDATDPYGRPVALARVLARSPD